MIQASIASLDGVRYTIRKAYFDQNIEFEFSEFTNFLLSLKSVNIDFLCHMCGSTSIVYTCNILRVS